jgi:hypothetical protein
MLIVEHLFGLGFLLVGLVALTSYNDEMSKWHVSLFYDRLKPMQERWGKLPGTLLHIFSYVITPVGFGLLFLMGMVF